jgi:hypothetical protein
MGKNGTGWDFFAGFQSHLAMFGNETLRGSAAQWVLVLREWVERTIPSFLRHQLRFVDDGQPATANRRDRGGDLAVPEENRARSLLILFILPAI